MNNQQGRGGGRGEEEGRGERRVGVSTGSFYIGLGAYVAVSHDFHGDVPYDVYHHSPLPIPTITC